MNSDERPDPDQLLASITRRDAAAKTGKLHIFFGMSAGVGKTFAMLSAARTKKAEGLDIVIGLIETHGRSETAALAEGIETIPRKSIAYRGVTLTEMDLDVLLQRRPQLALVDELAHTNVPGSRHPKRWQDVVELLEAGIDVYTTLNVQHVESRKGMVEAIGGITVQETVPDALLERATFIELVDVTPAELLKRLAEGKVYLGERAERAAANFFQEDRLTALREMALRLTAEKVDNDLHDLMSARSGAERLASADRLMVAVSHSPHSESLIRATRRIAFGLGVPWMAVHVDTGIGLTPEDRARLSRNLQLVQELGGELISTADTDIAEALERIARQRGVTQMVVGRPTPRWRDHLWGGSILDRLARRHSGYDILVLRSEPHGMPRPRRPLSGWEQQFTAGSNGLALSTVVAVALLNWLLLPVIGYQAVGFLFLISVLLVSLVVSFAGVVMAAILSAMIWDFFFIPPFLTLHISRAEDLMMVSSYFVAAVVTGMLAQRIQTRQRLIREREERTEVLFDLAKSLVAKAGIEDAIESLRDKLKVLLRGEIDIVPARVDGNLAMESVLNAAWLQGDKERAVAAWAHTHGQSAGWSTTTLPSAAARYLPLRTISHRPLGLLAFHPERDRRMTQDEENLLSAVAHQISLALERILLQTAAQEAHQLKESERLMQTVIDSVSHELRTPLTAIAGSASALASPDIAANAASRELLTYELLTMADRLNRLVGNLLDMSRLSSGTMVLKRDWHDPRDLVSSALELTGRSVMDHRITCAFDDDLPLVRIDIQLMSQAVANVIANAGRHAPNGTAVAITLTARKTELLLTIEDEGPGIPEEVLPRLFTKFYRAPGSPSGGLGLGLAIAKAIVEAHGGSITAANRAAGGACFTLVIPADTQPEVPSEEDER